MGNKRDYYDVLGLKKGASDGEIKSAYRKLVKKYHPDARPDDAEAEAMMKDINEAYDVLSDSQKKADYDQYGHSKPEQGKTRKEEGPFSGSGFGGSGDINIDDLFTGGFGAYFRSGGGRNDPGRGRDVKADIRISYNESVSGTEKEVTINYSEKCSSCNGTGVRSGQTPGVCSKCNGARFERVVISSGFGKMTQTRECEACNGTGKDMSNSCSRCSGRGYLKTSKRIKVKVPRNIVNGHTIRIKDLGDPSETGGARGDLIVKVIVPPKYGF